MSNLSKFKIITAAPRGLHLGLKQELKELGFKPVSKQLYSNLYLTIRIWGI